MIRRQIDTLQALRAIAALMVLVFHLNIFTLQAGLGADGPLWTGFLMGYAGVEIFFVLSGFIMIHVHRGDFGQARLAPRFLWKRVVRIYPILWIVLALVLIARLAQDGSAAVPSAAAFLKAITLWPDFVEPILRVTWSLSYEMLFYLIFSLAIINPRIGAGIAAVWFTACVVNFGTRFEWDALTLLLSPYNLLFLFGMVTAWGYARLSVGQAWLALSLGTAVFFAVGLAEVYGVATLNTAIRTWAYGLSGAAVIAGLAALDEMGRIRTPKLLVVLGDASYSIYLIHILAMSVAAKVLSVAGLGAVLPLWLSTVIIASGGVVAGVIVHFVFEKPAIRLVRTRLEPRLALGRA